MNREEYLMYLGSKLEEIRKLFGWRQEDTATRIGISRSKVVTIENDPSKLTVCDAQSLFIACDHELYIARRIFSETKAKRNKKMISTLIASSVFLTSPLFASSIISLVATLKPKSVSKFIPILSGVFGSVWATASAKIKKEKQIEALTNENIIDFHTLAESMQITITELEKNLIKIFSLNEWDSHSFYEKIHPELKIPKLEEYSE
ncbi:helix-turn-helix domain-containing protein [Schinkia sp. CFF1]